MKLVISNSGEVSKPFIERINLIQCNIVDQDTDAIAMVVPQNLDFSGSLNEAIAAAAGYDLDGFILDNIYKPRAGEVYALPGGDLPAKHIMLGIMPYYRTEFDRRESDLSGVVRKIMEVARCMLLTSISIPPISSGRHGYPKPKAARLICQGINERMQESMDEVRIICPDPKSVEIFDAKLRVVGWKS